MTGLIAIKPVGDWASQTEKRLIRAMAATIDVTGRNAADELRRGLILMARSARAATPKAKKTRPVFKNPYFAHLMKRKQYKEQKMLGKDMARYYQWAAWKWYQGKDYPTFVYSNDKERYRKIKNAGLAKRSWFWGLNDIGQPSDSNPIPGVADTRVVRGNRVSGFVLTNRLSYLDKIMPPGWYDTVITNVSKQVEHDLTKRIGAEWGRAVMADRTAAARPLSDYFLVAA